MFRGGAEGAGAGGAVPDGVRRLRVSGGAIPPIPLAGPVCYQRFKLDVTM